MVGGGLIEGCSYKTDQVESYRVETGEWLVFTALKSSINLYYSPPVLVETAEHGLVPFLFGGFALCSTLTDNVFFANGSDAVPLGQNFKLSQKMNAMAAVPVRVNCE